jgi:hypothetical protein
MFPHVWLLTTTSSSLGVQFLQLERLSSFNGGAVSPVFPIEEEETNALGTPLLAAAAASDNFPQPHSNMIWCMIPLSLSLSLVGAILPFIFFPFINLE